MSRRDELWDAISQVLARNVPSDYEGVDVDKDKSTPKKSGKKDSKKSKN